MDEWRNLIAIVAASLVFVSALCWLAAIVYTVGIWVGKPWMMGHGTVNDVLLICAGIMFAVADFCWCVVLRQRVDGYLSPTGETNALVHDRYRVRPLTAAGVAPTQVQPTLPPDSDTPGAQ